MTTTGEWPPVEDATASPGPLPEADEKGQLRPYAMNAPASVFTQEVDTGREAGGSSKYKLTDVGNAARLVDAYGQDFRYVANWGTWLVWDGRRWKRDGKGKIVEAAKAVARNLWREVASEPDATRRKDLARWAGQSEGANRIDAMVRLARSAPTVAIEPEELDSHPWLLNVANGTLDLEFRKGGLRPHRREDLLTKLAPVVHDEDERASCPTWLRFLEQILPDRDVRTFVQDAVGYALVGVTTEHVLFFSYGTGANGKTTWAQTMLALFGDYGRQAEPDLLLANREAHPTGVADLVGARFVVSTEIDDGRRLAEATVKRLTGGDRLKARFMRQDFFEFEPTHTLFLVANHRPIVKGTDHAIWRRLRLIPFTVTIPPEDQDHNLGEKLQSELPGILLWALVGCRRWQTSGLSAPPAVMLATDSYRAEMDVLGSFLEENTVVMEGAYVAAADLYRAYQDWCEANGERVASQRRFGAALTERGFERCQYGPERRWHWFGLGLLNPRTELNPPFPITDRTRARDRQTGSTGSEGFTGSQQERLA